MVRLAISRKLSLKGKNDEGWVDQEQSNIVERIIRVLTESGRTPAEAVRLYELLGDAIDDEVDPFTIKTRLYEAEPDLKAFTDLLPTELAVHRKVSPLVLNALTAVAAILPFKPADTAFDEARIHSLARMVERRFNNDADITTQTSPIVRDQPKIGRNDPCPCGSGKKHKRCCGSAI